MRRIIAVVSCALVVAHVTIITGCAATNPLITLDGVVVNDERATVVFFRPKAPAGFLMSFDLIANGILIGELKNGSTVSRQLMPGEYKLHSKNGGAVIDRITTMKLEPGQIYFVKVYLVSGAWVNSVYFQPVAPKVVLSDRDLSRLYR